VDEYWEWWIYQCIKRIFQNAEFCEFVVAKRTCSAVIKKAIRIIDIWGGEIDWLFGK